MSEPTTGAQWAIARFEELYERPEYHALTDSDGDSRAIDISGIIAELQAGTHLALVMAMPAARPVERHAILAAALSADARAAVLEPHLKAMGGRIGELDRRTSGIQRYGGQR